jgi:heme iron utilization protein
MNIFIAARGTASRDEGKREPMSSARQHAAAPSNVPPVPEPSHAERARTLLSMERIGSLSTLSRKQPGFPFGSIMPYAIDETGRPIFLISTMAMHTQNLLADPRASLLVSQPDPSGDPLGASRVTLIGNVAGVPEAELPDARSLYLARYENSRYWVDFKDFSFFRLQVVDVYFVGGFGVMGWVSAEDYSRAAVDPLASHAAGIIEHMNADHRDSLVLLARVFAGITPEEATMTSVDRLGFHVRLKTAEGTRGARIGFLREVVTPTDARKVLIEMVQQARLA